MLHFTLFTPRVELDRGHLTEAFSTLFLGKVVLSPCPFNFGLRNPCKAQAKCRGSEAWEAGGEKTLVVMVTAHGFQNAVPENVGRGLLQSCLGGGRSPGENSFSVQSSLPRSVGTDLSQL